MHIVVYSSSNSWYRSY